MTKDKTYDPLEGFKQLSEILERQLNGLLYMITDNKAIVSSAKVGIESHSRYMEILRKDQELIAGYLNVPTKKDVANVAKLSVQTEEKIDTLEGQIWNLQDSVNSLNIENLDLFQEMVKVVKQMKTEFQKTAQELAETNGIKTDLQELRQGIVEMKIMQVNLQHLRKELEDIKEYQAKIEINDSAETKIIQMDLQELKQGIGQLTDIKSEMATLKKLIKKEKEKGLVLTGNGTST